MNILESNDEEVEGFQFGGGLPSYLIAADSHSVANGQGSIADESSWIGNAPKFVMSAMTRAVTSAFNTVPSVGNLLGGEFELIDTEEVLTRFDDDLGQYYSENRQSVDVVGDVVGMFVPGMAGVKVLNWGQKVVAGATKGRAGWTLAKGFGTLPTKADTYAKAAIADIASNSSTFSIINANTLKAIGSGYGQLAMEGAAFEIAAAVSMSSSPLFEDHTAKDILANALYGGGLIGGGISGSVLAVQTYGKINKARVAADAARKPFTHITEVEAGTPAWVQLQHRINDKVSIPSTTDPTELRLAKQKINNIDVAIRNDLNTIVGTDKEIGNSLADIVRGYTPTAAFDNLTGLEEAGRMTRLMAAEKPKKAATQFVKFGTVWGDDAGKIDHVAPPVVRIGDTAANAEEAKRLVANYKHSADNVRWSPLNAADHLEVEARYLTAATMKAPFESGVTLGADDIPFLEKALRDQVDVVIDGVTHNPTDLRLYLAGKKEELALKLLEQNAVLVDQLNTATIAKMVNVRKSFLEGALDLKNPDLDLFAYQGFVGNNLDKLFEPSIIKLGYKYSPVMDVNGNVLQGMVAIKEVQKLQQEAIDRVFADAFGANSDNFIKLTDADVLATNSEGAGAGIASAASANYGSTAAKAEWIGKNTNKLITEARKQVDATFTPRLYGLIQNTKAGAEFAAIKHQYHVTPERYVLDPTGRRLVNAELAKYEAAVAAGKKNVKLPVYIDDKAPKIIPIQHDETLTALEDWIRYNDDKLTTRYNANTVQGIKVADNRGKLYFPPPDPKQFNHFAFVVDPSVTGTGHVQMIWAASAEELAEMSAKVPSEFELIYKSQSEKFFKAMREYDYDLGINENYINSALFRRGVSANFLPKTDMRVIADELISYRNKADSALIRDLVTLKYSRQMKEFRSLGEQFTALTTSRSAPIRKFAEETEKNPYIDYVKTMLDIPVRSNIPVWTEFNNLAETLMSKTWNKVSESWARAKTPEQLDEVAAAFDRAGLKVGYKDAATEMLANHSAPKPALSRFVTRANSLFSLTMLRTDPLNAMNNGVGSLVLTGSETKYLINAIEKGSKEAAGELAGLAKIKLPGTDKSILSPAKLIARAYKSWFSNVMGNADAGAMKAEFAANGWLPDMVDQLRMGLDELTLTGLESSTQLDSKIAKAMKHTAEVAEKISLNQSVEQMNRFVSAHIAKELTDLGIKHGVLGKKEALAYINTFVNRTQGNYMASQRPLMFQGPLGQSIGLFMTYQFNLLQHVFRHISEGRNANLAYMLGLQGSIYGLNGLPAFNAINTHIIGTASGNTENSDVISTVFDVAGKELGDWLVYGAASNVSGIIDPDLKINLYTRGDINPRHVTVIPTSVADVPIVGAFTGVLRSILETGSKLSAGGDTAQTILQGIEHLGISRPLAGIAVTLQGLTNPEGQSFSTTRKGNIMMANDMMSLTSLARIAGARPLDEAVARDAYYRVQVYEGNKKEEIAQLGSAIRTKVQAGSAPSQDEVEEFLQKYVHLGGDQKNFFKFWQQQVKQADRSQVNILLDSSSSRFSTYMQKIMGGYELQDFTN